MQVPNGCCEDISVLCNLLRNNGPTNKSLAFKWRGLGLTNVLQKNFAILKSFKSELNFFDVSTTSRDDSDWDLRMLFTNCLYMFMRSCCTSSSRPIEELCFIVIDCMYGGSAARGGRGRGCTRPTLNFTKAFLKPPYLIICVLLN